MIINDILTIKPCLPGKNNDNNTNNQTVPETNNLSNLLGSNSNNSNVDQKAQLAMQFSNESGLTLDFAMQCLESKNWDYNVAAQHFMELKNSGQITQAMMK